MKILLAEDTRDLNRAVTVILQHEGYDVDSAYDGEEALDFVMKDSYDAIILDIMMPKKDGIEVLKEIRARHLVMPVMLLTAKSEIDDRVEGLDAGADDYLSKPFAMKELLARVRALTRRGREYNQEVMTFGNVTLSSENFMLSAANGVRLSVKEYEVMQQLLINIDHGVSTAYLMEHIWKGEPGCTEDTIWLYIAYLKGKLHSIGAEVEIAGEHGGTFQLIRRQEA